jgi:hypothetical protein
MLTRFIPCIHPVANAFTCERLDSEATAGPCLATTGRRELAAILDFVALNTCFTNVYLLLCLALKQRRLQGCLRSMVAACRLLRLQKTKIFQRSADGFRISAGNACRRRTAIAQQSLEPAGHFLSQYKQSTVQVAPRSEQFSTGDAALGSCFSPANELPCVMIRTQMNAGSNEPICSVCF